jgi:hypothetical protein
MRKPLLASPTIGSQGGVIGRPRKQPPEDAAAIIQKLASEGRGIMGVASQLRTDRGTLQRWFEENPELREAFEAGKEQERHELHQILLRDARDGEKPNINAIFLLKARHGYREGDTGEQPSRLNITFNLPGAMSKEDFMKTVVADG